MNPCAYLGTGYLNAGLFNGGQVLEKASNGWWFVERAQDQGWVPESYLQQVGESEQVKFMDCLLFIIFTRNSSVNKVPVCLLSFAHMLAVCFVQRHVFCM